MAKLIEKQSEALVKLSRLALTLNNARPAQEALAITGQLDPAPLVFPEPTTPVKTAPSAEYDFIDSADALLKD